MPAPNEPVTMPRPDIGEDTRADNRLGPVYNVVCWNDPVNLMSYVAMAFRRIFGWTRERAERHMMEVHTKGRSVVWSGRKEQAELYVQQLHGFLLLATLEKAPA